MIFLFTDFGADDLYVGQVKAVLHTHAAAKFGLRVGHPVALDGI
jgi:S-adenosylmethionine hydrolase